MREPFRKASLYIAFLLMLEVLVGLIIIVTTGIYQTVLAVYLAEMERRQLGSTLVHVYVFGFQLIVLYVCSVSIWNRLWPRRCTPNVQMLLTIWLFFCLLIIFCGFVTVWALFQAEVVLEHAAEMSLTHGIDLYYSCPEWKLLWDSLQLHKQCCGVRSYKDWMNAEWMPADDGCANYSNSVLAPYTCCKRSCVECFQNYGNPQQCASQGKHPFDGTSAKPFPSINIAHINQNGCLPVFTDTLWRYLYILIVLVALSMKFMIILCCLTKYVIHKQGQCNKGPNFTDDDGRPLVVVKYPSNVRCITLGEDDLASDIPAAENYCNCDEAIAVCEDGADYYS